MGSKNYSIAGEQTLDSLQKYPKNAIFTQLWLKMEFLKLFWEIFYVLTLNLLRFAKFCYVLAKFVTLSKI